MKPSNKFNQNSAYRPSDTDAFVRRVMTQLPARQSLAERMWQRVLRFVLSPLWIWLCLVILVVGFRKPLLAFIAAIPQFSPTGIVLSALSSIGILAFFTYQMLLSARFDTANRR